MNFDQCTELSRRVIRAAVERARAHQHGQVESAHLLMALSLETESLLPPVLEKLNVSTDAFRRDASGLVSALPRQDGASLEPRMGSDLLQVLQGALAEAEAMGDSFVATEHLFLGLLTRGNGSVQKLMKEHGVERDAFLAVVQELRAGRAVHSEGAESHRCLLYTSPSPRD